MRSLFLLPVIALAGCVPAPDSQGTVTEYNGASVTIRGQGDFSLANAGKGFTPTPGVIAQAKTICPGAHFVSWSPNKSSEFLIDYLFICR